MNTGTFRRLYIKRYKKLTLFMHELYVNSCIKLYVIEHVDLEIDIGNL
jgi:hypothetical protein